MYNSIKYIIVTLLMISAPVSRAETPKKQPNILMIMIDDLRPDLNVYGNKLIKSPNIDALANEGVTFANAFSNVPVCGASRASIFAGMYPTTKRFTSVGSKMDKDAPNVPTLPELLKKNGYNTFGFGKVYHGRADSRDSWTDNKIWYPNSKGATGGKDYQSAESLVEWKKVEPTISHIKNHKKRMKRLLPTVNAYEAANVDDDAYFGGKIANKAIAKLKNLKKSDKPFFMAVGFMKPHLPFNAPKKYWDMYNPEDIELPTNPTMPKSAPKAAFHPSGEIRNFKDIPASPAIFSDDLTRKLRHGYYASVSYSDAMVGKVLATLKHLGMDKDTIVILTSDHGFSLGEHGLWVKHSNYKLANHVPLIVKIPGQKGNTRVNGLVDYVDIYPSLTQLAGLSIPPHAQGKSFVQALNNPNSKTKDAVFWRWKNGETILSGGYTYTAWFNKKGKRMDHMLFELKTDAGENNNLAEAPAYKATVKKLQAKLVRHMNNR